MTLKEFGSRYGVTEAAVRLWVKRGLVRKQPDGKIDVAASDKLLAERPGFYKGGVTKRLNQ